MSWRGWRMLLTVLLLVAGGGGAALSTPGRLPAGTTELRPTAATTRCHGITAKRQVRGTRPTYTRKKLAVFTNHVTACHAIWLPEPRRHFVPQGLAVSGHTAWISGYRFHKAFGRRQCQLLHVDLVTGRRMSFHPSLRGSIGDGPRGFCRHGGGVVQRGSWLWVSEKGRLWLLRARQRTSTLSAARVWRIHGPARGSAVVVSQKRVGLVPYQTTGHPHVYWFSRAQMMRRRVRDLAPTRTGAHTIRAVASTRVPRYVQGATLDRHGRLYLTRSNLSCAELVTPYGRRVGLVPGAEGIDFASGGRRLWVVSESGAVPYAHSRKPLTPAVTSFQFPRLLHGRQAGCGFARY